MIERIPVLNTISDVCQIMDEAGYDITELIVVLRAVDLKTGWTIELGKCRVCASVEVNICPVGCDVDNLECNNCNNMTMQRKEPNEWWQ